MRRMSRYCFWLLVCLTAGLGACGHKQGAPLCAGYYLDELEAEPGKSLLHHEAEGSESVIVLGYLREVQGNCFYIFTTQQLGDDQALTYTMVDILAHRSSVADSVSKQRYFELLKNQPIAYHYTAFL